MILTPARVAADLLDSPRRSNWRQVARPEQLPPPAWLREWYVRGSRGGGKTRTGAENFAELIEQYKTGAWAVVAPTYGDARDTCIEGESGLLAAYGTTREEVDAELSKYVKTWNRSIGELVTRSGATVFVDGADDGALRVQGKNLRGCWADEIGLWSLGARSRSQENLSKTVAERAWDESIQFAVRIRPALIIATGTPKSGHPLPRRLIRDRSIPKTFLRLEDNEENLDPGFVANLRKAYEDTRLGRQELGGEDLEEIAGALWSLAQLEACQVAKPPQKRRLEDNDWVYEDDLIRVVVGVDPAATSGPDSDETGIVVCAKAVDGRGYVLADRTCRMSPDGWGRRVIAACLDFRADCIVLETNQGGEMAAAVLRTSAQSMGVPCPRIRKVHASQGKRLRAEPIVALYEQGRISHCIVYGGLGQLEGEMTQFTPDSGFSPDRVDSMVHAMTELMVSPARTLRFFA